MKDDGAQEKFYRTLFMRSPISVLLIDPATTLPVEFNDSACRQLGYTREEFARLRISDYEAAESAKETAARIEKVSREGCDSFMTQHRTKGGEILDVLVTVWKVELSGRTLFQCVLRDVTENEKTERRVKSLASIVEMTPEGIVVTGLNGIIRYVNPSWEKMNGWSAGSVVGKVTPRILKSGRNERAVYEKLWRTIMGGEVFRSELTNRRKDGSFYETEIVIMPIKDAVGSITGFSGIERDITERKRSEDALHQAEAQLRQSQKMESVGRLAGGIAHDFNNLLTAISGYSQFLLGSIDLNDPRRADAVEIKKAGDRAASLTRQLLAFSRKQVLQPRILDLNVVVVDIEKLLRRLIGEDIELRVIPSQEPACVNADPGNLEQVILNLAVNARDAMVEGGKLSIEIGMMRFDDAYAHTHGTVQPGDYAALSVADTGIGMSQEVQSHLFEPFFTTKERDKGTGLGLSTIYGIVTQSGGHIAVYSELGRGTCFKIYLPYVVTSAQIKEPPAKAPQLFDGTATILLVEDDKRIRQLAQRILVQRGFTVLEAGTGEEALAICERRTDPIHLVLTDMVMPGISGPQLVERVSSLRPEMKVAFMSGYTDHAVLAHGMLNPGISFIQKPFSSDILVQKIREALAAPANSGRSSRPR